MISQCFCDVKCHLSSILEPCLSSLLRWPRSCFTFNDFCCHFFHFLRKNMASEPVCRDRGLEFPHQAWVAFRKSPFLFVSTFSIHTKCCYIEYLCWHRLVSYLGTLWFINISMSWTSIYQALEHVDIFIYNPSMSLLFTVSPWVSQWMHSRTLFKIWKLISCWQSVVQTKHAFMCRS